MLTRLGATAVLGTVIALFGGCAESSEKAADTKTESSAQPNTVRRTEEIPVKVSIEVGGDLRAKVENETHKTGLVLVESDDPEVARSRIFGIETIAPIKVGNVAFTTGFAIVPYRGPDTYTIGEGAIFDTAKAGGQGGDDRSSVRVRWWPDAAGEDTHDYLRREKPCTVVVENGGSKGRISCPQLTNESRDKHFSLDMRWEFVEGA